MKDAKAREYFEAGRNTAMARGLVLDRPHSLKIIQRKKAKKVFSDNTLNIEKVFVAQQSRSWYSFI